LVLFVRIRTFQWVTTKKIEKIPRRFGASELPRGASSRDQRYSTDSDFHKGFSPHFRSPSGFNRHASTDEALDFWHQEVLLARPSSSTHLAPRAPRPDMS
jgi:hypothetical protein